MSCAQVGETHERRQPSLNTPVADTQYRNMASITQASFFGLNSVRSSATKKIARRHHGFAVRAGTHWLPGTQPPPYLDGTMAGDYGVRTSSIIFTYDGRLWSGFRWLPLEHRTHAPLVSTYSIYPHDLTPSHAPSSQVSIRFGSAPTPLHCHTFRKPSS